MINLSGKKNKPTLKTNGIFNQYQMNLFKFYPLSHVTLQELSSCLFGISMHTYFQKMTPIALLFFLEIHSSGKFSALF